MYCIAGQLKWPRGPYMARRPDVPHPWSKVYKNVARLKFTRPSSKLSGYSCGPCALQKHMCSELFRSQKRNVCHSGEEGFTSVPYIELEVNPGVELMRTPGLLPATTFKRPLHTSPSLWGSVKLSLSLPLVVSPSLFPLPFSFVTLSLSLSPF